MINTVLVEDDLYIQKHFTERLNADGEFRLVGIYRDAFEAEKHCGSDVQLILMEVEMEGTMSDSFSPRQLDILRWYIRGLTYQEIADKFGISKNGVRWNLDDMVEKGGFENREALVATAIENKLMVTTLKDE